jgi:hypothetical protein
VLTQIAALPSDDRPAVELQTPPRLSSATARDASAKGAGDAPALQPAASRMLNYPQSAASPLRRNPVATGRAAAEAAATALASRLPSPGWTVLCAPVLRQRDQQLLFEASVRAAPETMRCAPCEPAASI